VIAEVSSSHLDKLIEKIETRNLTAGIVGLGYVGLPLANLFRSQGFNVLGLDIDLSKTEKLMNGESYIGHIPASTIREMRKGNRFVATADFSTVATADTVSICVPTPLDRFKQPDLTAVRNTAEHLVPYLRSGQLIILESTTYPGTTTEVLLPILQKSGLKIGDELFVGYSLSEKIPPTRISPPNPFRRSWERTIRCRAAR